MRAREREKDLAEAGAEGDDVDARAGAEPQRLELGTHKPVKARFRPETSQSRLDSGCK